MGDAPRQVDESDVGRVVPALFGPLLGVFDWYGIGAFDSVVGLRETCFSP